MILSVVVTILSACAQVLDSTYYLKRPQILLNVAERCQRGDSPPKGIDCTQIQRLAEDLLLNFRLQQQDPEEFGHALLDAQTNYSEAAKAYNEALKNKQKTSINLIELQGDYQKLREKTDLMLAALALTHPE
mgnify:FL=1